MDTITICDLEVFYHIGVPAEERAKTQRLLLTIEIRKDFAPPRRRTISRRPSTTTRSASDCSASGRIATGN